MSSPVVRRLCTLALAAVLAGCSAAPQPSGYRFELLSPHVPPSQNAEVRVRLLHLPDSRPVTGANIYEHASDMAHRADTSASGYAGSLARVTPGLGAMPPTVFPSWMAEGPNPPPVPAVEEGNGVYRVHATLPMAGDWMLTLVARVPGEAEPVRGRFKISVR